MPLKLRPTGLGSGIDKDRPTTPSTEVNFPFSVLAGRVGALDIYRLRDEPRAIILVAYQVRLEGDVQRRRNLSLTAPFRPAQRSCRSGLLKNRLELRPLRRAFCRAHRPTATTTIRAGFL
jgi:hypothetical protein